MKTGKVYLLALTAILLWSTAGTAFKLALKGMGFIQLLFIASTTAWIVLGTVVIARRQTHILFENPLKNLSRSAIGGFLNPFLYYMVLLKAYTLLPAQLAQPLNYTWPVMLTILSVIILKKKLKPVDLPAMIISFAGVVVISSQGQNPFTNPVSQPLGIILAVGSSVIWAYYWIFNLSDKRPELIKITLNFFFGSLFSGMTLLLLGLKLPEPSTHYYPALYVGLTEMAIAFVCWLTALESSESHAKISNLVFISPFLALFFIHLILGESIYWTTPVGLVFITGGILIQQFAGKIKFKRG